MTNPGQLPTSVLNRSVRRAVFALALACVLVTIPAPSAQAQTLTVLHNFTGGVDGANPDAGLTMDRAGNLYGTTSGGEDDSGSVFKLTHTNGRWTFALLYSFSSGENGYNPYAGVVVGSDGTLYGTTQYGGVHGWGTVFNLKPAPHVSPNLFAPWIESVLYSFQGGTDGTVPYGSVTFDQAGNIYGTTTAGGTGCFGVGCGTVYQLTHSGSGGWTESVLYAFSGSDGLMPLSGVTLDSAGNIYGTTWGGGVSGSGYGTVYELTYSAGSGWAESFLYSFTAEGVNTPYAGLIFDPSGNLYGATAGEAGGVFELTPFDGTWTYSLLDGGLAPGEPNPPPGSACGARGNLVMDGAGNLYGTTFCDGAYGDGSVFKLTPMNGGWTYTTVYSFTGGNDGYWPASNVVIDANGNLYGTTVYGGQYGGYYGYGVVWEITP